MGREQAWTSSRGIGPALPDPGASVAAGGDFDYRDPVQSFMRTAREALTRPGPFFAGIRRQGDFVNPLIFAILGGSPNALNSIAAGTSGVGGAVAGRVGGLIFTPVLVGFFSLKAPVSTNCSCCSLSGPPTPGTRPPQGSAGYAGAILLISGISSLFNLIPVIGPVIGGLLGLLIGVYAVVIQVLGIREVHSTTTGRAVVIVLLPAVVIFLIALLVVGAALLVVFGVR